MGTRDPVPPRRITPLATPTYVPVGSGFPLTEQAIVTLVKAALDEDRASEDVTTISTVVSTRSARASTSLPGSVRPRMRLPWRTKTSTPSSASSSRMPRETAGCEVPIACAARVRLKWWRAVSRTKRSC